MWRRVVLALALSSTACIYDPPGDCTADTQCGLGGRCAEGVCIWRCTADDHCQAWQACDTAARECVTRPGRCDAEEHCSAWQRCDAPTNTCVLDEGSCEDASHCASWETCDTASHGCEPLPGRCSDAADCAAYETCDASNTCVLASGRCTEASHCDEWESCTANSCVPLAGRCNAVSDCPGLWPSCDGSHFCRSSPPGGHDVVLVGTLQEGLCGREAIASVLTPTQIQVGFECDMRDVAFISAGGDIVYETWHNGSYVLRRFVPDALTWDGSRWQYPLTPEANDPLVPTPGCTPPASGHVAREGSTEFTYFCGSGQRQYYRNDGAVLFQTDDVVKAWNAAGSFLLDSISDLVVLTPGQAPVTVTGLPYCNNFITARGAGADFLAAVNDCEADVRTLYRINPSGVATLVGTYGRVSDDRDTQWLGSALAANGWLYTTVSEFPKDAVYRRSPDGTVVERIYTEADAPAGANDFSAETFSPYTMMHGSDLLTGP